MAAQLTGRGGLLVGPKAQVFPKIIFDGTPNNDDEDANDENGFCENEIVIGWRLFRLDSQPSTGINIATHETIMMMMMWRMRRRMMMLYDDRDDDADEKMKSPKVGEKESRRWSRHLSVKNGFASSILKLVLIIIVWG